MGVMETAGPRGIPLIIPIAATAEITDRIRREPARFRAVFRVSYSIPQWAETLAAFLKARKTARYAFVGTGIPMEQGARERARERGRPAGDRGRVRRLLQPGEPRVRPGGRRGRRKRRRHRRPRGPRQELPLLPEAAAGAFSRGARPVRRRGGWGTPVSCRLALPARSGPLYVQAAAWKGSTPSATAYVERFGKRFGYARSGYSDTLPYDAVTVLVAAWRRAGSTEGNAVAAALEKGTFQGPPAPIVSTIRTRRHGPPGPATCAGRSSAGSGTAAGSSSAALTDPGKPPCPPLPQLLLDAS
jgi:hypothetical protein